ncbi:type II toxin-antitoxin system Phd/YefM family antitoxin [Sphingomonas sp. LT1P40]|uniref:type II toxin-antitoxin system Phd/YefM family antitoxin n=1 Tax=Alteristakelama amylovorans TaxID=3096166 RepID=UPI002FCA2A66
MKVISSRDFNQDVSQAKRLARVEPVFVTDRGKPTHVLMSIAAFQQLTGATESVVDLLAMPGSAPVALDSSFSGEGWDRRAKLG